MLLETLESKLKVPIERILKIRETVKEREILYVGLSLTEKCNLSCAYPCLSYDNASKTDPSLQQVKDRLKKLRELDTAISGFYGGEPTLFKALPEAIAYANNLGLFTYIATNGMFSEKVMRAMGDSGLDMLQFAVDHYRPIIPGDITRKYLRDDKLNMLLEGREKFGYLLWFNCCTTDDNKDDLVRILKLAKEHHIGVIIHLASNTIPRNQRDYGGPIDVSPVQEPEDIMDLAQTFLEMKGEGYPILSPTNYFENWIRAAEGKPLEWDCGAARDSFQVNPDGTISACVTILRPLKGGYHIDTLTHDGLKLARAEVETDLLPYCNHQCLATTSFCTADAKLNPKNIESNIKLILGL